MLLDVFFSDINENIFFHLFVGGCRREQRRKDWRDYVLVSNFPGASI
jgi:hypothetical protein